MEKTEIQKFYTGQTIFITGGTGFLGKCLIEKLLRACYDLNRIYVLVRTKKGKGEEERFKEMFEAACFQPLKELYPNFLEKITMVYGDCLKPDLGLSGEFKEILRKEVTTIFHCAATVRFDQDLRSATYINVRSVVDLIRMAKEMTQLRAFVHVSTAYSNSPRSDIHEEFYDPPMAHQKLMNLVESLDDETIKAITPTLLKDWPNTYVYTKCVAESVIANEAKNMPIAMVRPGIVTATAKEPIPGWIDNIYGINGVVAGAGMGVIHTMNANPEMKAEVVPLDFVINNILAAAWNLEKQRVRVEKPNDIPIYNLVVSPFFLMTYGRFLNLCTIYGLRIPPSKAVWYYSLTLCKNPILFEITAFLYHTLPAYLVDFILLCIGRKRIAVDGVKKLRKYLEVIAYFATRSWNFDAKNVKRLLSIMSPEDRELFSFDMKEEDLETIVRDAMFGGRVHLIKDPVDTIPYARKRKQLLRIVHYIFLSLVLFSLYKIIRFTFGLFF